MQASEIYGWEAVDELLKSSTLELLFGERLKSLSILLPLVRFPLMPSTTFKKVCFHWLHVAYQVDRYKQ